MRRALMTALLCAAVLGCQSSTPAAADQAGAAGPAAQTAAKPAPQASGFDSSKAYEHLRQMVLHGPRPAGSAALKQSREYIKAQMAGAGVPVTEQAWTAQTPIGPVNMVNLIARLPGRRTDRILITGHYDTKLIKTSTFVGASDGASSAAILIELARVLKTRSHEYTYEFVWFDGEEAFCFGWDECGRPDAPDNTYGSRYYVDSSKKGGTLGSIKAMILFDMIGAKDLKLRKDTEFAAAWLNDIFWATAKKMGYGATFIDLNGDVGGDDHEPFARAGVPTIDLIDLHDYPQWHNDQACCDDLDHVSARSLQIVGDVFLAAMPDVEKHLMSGR
ncbi:MAG TPA: M28 family peptidase [Vicinamibacterales bacterium]|nr:M28 family peptidase [Vicinamibacterales bacterium]